LHLYTGSNISGPEMVQLDFADWIVMMNTCIGNDNYLIEELDSDNLINEFSNPPQMKQIEKRYMITPFYGVPRMTLHLRYLGHEVNHKRVRRLYRKMGMYAAVNVNLAFNSNYDIYFLWQE